MKVLAINGSPRAQNSGTFRLLEALLGGMEEAGATTELLHAKKLNMEPCNGCYQCWVRTPGVCVHHDDMTGVIETYNASDFVIFGTPVYHCSMTGIMKTFLDRLLPRYEPWLIPHPDVPGMTGHPPRWSGPDRMVLVSTCGFPEFETFDALRATFRQIARLHGMRYVGEVLRTFGEPLANARLTPLFSSYLAAVRRAGQHLIESDGIPAELQAELRHDLFPGGKERLYELANEHWSRLRR